MHDSTPDSDTSFVEEDDKLSIQSELLRKGLHVLALIIPLGMVVLERHIAVAVTGILALACIALELSRACSTSVNGAVITVLGPIMRRSEEQTALDRMEFSGATHIMVSAAVLSLLFPSEIGAPVLAMFVVSDGFAAVVGRNYGRIQFPCNDKTVEGFLTFSLVGTFMLLITTDFPALLSVLVSLLSGALEISPMGVNDNLYVPPISSLVLFYAL